MKITFLFVDTDKDLHFASESDKKHEVNIYSSPYITCEGNEVWKVAQTVSFVVGGGGGGGK